MQYEQVRESLPSKIERTVELAAEKGASNWLTVIPIREMNFNLNKREFRDAIKLGMTGRSLTYRLCAYVVTYLPLTMLWSAGMGG